MTRNGDGCVAVFLPERLNCLRTSRRTLKETDMNFFQADETGRRQLPSMPIPRPGGDDNSGPSAPKVKRPDSRQLLERMKRVDPDQAKRYRQRSGE
jgi:hypothetical protein